MIYLKQSTASQSVLLGPFVDDTDGVTAETGLTIAASDIRLSANGGNMAAKNSGGGTHDENGWYTITLDATDTATVGRLQISCKVAGALPVYLSACVLEEVVYDALFGSGATGALPVSDKTGFALSSGGLNAVTLWNCDITGDFTGNLSGTVLGFADSSIANLDDLAAALATAHGAGSWSTADVSSLATTTNLDTRLSAARLQAIDDLIDGGRLDLLIDAIKTAAERLTAARAAVLDDLIDGGRLDVLIDSAVTQATTAATEVGKVPRAAAAIAAGASIRRTNDDNAQTIDETITGVAP